MHPRAQPRPVLRHEGRGGRRRLCPGRADGRDQSAFHRGLSRHRRRQQSARGDDRQPRLLGQFARHRSAPHRLAARHRHERPQPAPHRVLARRGRQRIPARGRFRHHGRVRGDGDLLPRARSRRSQAAAREYHRGLYPRPQAGARRTDQRPRRHDRAAQGRARAQSGADARGHAGVRARRSVRQHRARLQLGAGDDDSSRIAWCWSRLPAR